MNGMGEDMSNRVPAEAFPPGEYLRDEIESRGWTQVDFAKILNRPAVVVNQIISGKRSITPDTAKALSAALGTSAEMWLNLESAYQLWKAKTPSTEDVSRRAQIYSLAPVSEMIRRNWITPSDNIDVLESQIKTFFSVSTLEDIQQIELKYAARKSSQYGVSSTAEVAWLFRARRMAMAIQAKRYDESRLTSLLPRLRELTLYPESTRHVPAMLAEIGVRFVVVEHLQKTRIDGAAFWLDAETPVVAVSLRFDRMDAFWHTVIHELVHVKNRDEAPVDTDIVRDSKGNEPPTPLSELEERTNIEAANYLIPSEKLDSFIMRVRPLYSKKRIVQFAEVNGVHPGIVIGQLQHRKEILWSHSREMLVPIREQILGAALADGFGHTPGAF